MGVLIKNCRLISPDIDETGVSIAMQDGTIQGLYSRGDVTPRIESVYDAHGQTAFPGFIDIHLHGAKGFDITNASAEALENIAKAKLEEGVTTFCPTTLTLPEKQLLKTLEAVQAYKENPSYAKVAGVHLEGPFINPDYGGAQNPEHIRQPDMSEVKRLNEVSKIVIVTFAPEMEGGFPFLHQLVSEEIIPSCGHSGATWSQFLKAKKAGLKHLSHFGNQMTALHQRDIGLVGAGLWDEDILLEIICDKAHLSPEMIALIFKVKPIERIALITDSICASGYADGDYELGGLEVKVEKGIASLVSRDALAGSTLRYNRGLKNVWEITGIPLKDLVKTTSYNQAKALGLPQTGKIEKGYVADVVITDRDFNVKAVFIEGQQRI